MNQTLEELQSLLQSRLAHPPEGSYSAQLFADPELIQRKIMEEAFELCLELGRDTVHAARTAEECADLIFHVLVGLTSVGVTLDQVESVLRGRSE